MTQYTAVFEQAADGTWSGYAPDLPTILAMGDTLELAEANMKEGIEIWMEEMKAAGYPIPAPSTRVVSIEVAA